MKLLSLLSTTAVIASLAFPAHAEELPDYKGTTLTGNWGGVRDSLAQSGINTDILYTADVVGNVSGGIKRSARTLNNVDLIVSIDGEKLFNSKGTTVFVDVLANDGRSPDGDLVGSAQGINNFEMGEPTVELYQAWIQQNMFDDKLSVLAGLYDQNSEFNVTDSSLLFIHSAYGLGTEFGLSGENGPSTFPYTSVAGRVKVQPTDQFYAQAAVMDGVPGDTDHQHGTHINFEKNDGVLMIGEVGYTPAGAKLAFGTWYYSEKTDELFGVDSSGNPLQKNNRGMYLIGERQLYQEPGAEGQGLAGFARLGIADKYVNPFDIAWTTGVVYTGLVPARDEGQLGFGMSGAHSSTPYEKAAIAAGTPVDSAEYQFELTYKDNITPWFAVQPDIQYVVNPGTDKSLDNALVLGSRFMVAF